MEYNYHYKAPITQTINTTTGIQEVTISIPWQEIADASNISLCGTAPIFVSPAEFVEDGVYEAPYAEAYSPVYVNVELGVYEDLLDDTWGS